MTAYQITSMMEGVVQRGTAAALAELGYPLAGKTGTTNEERDAWFIGYTPDLVVGLYLGYDRPRPMGKGSTGSGLAVPVFKELMKDVLKDKRPVPFRVPEGMTMISVDRKTGMRSDGPGSIVEAFKPGTGPADSYWVIGMDDFQAAERARELSPGASEAIMQGGGGLY
jgi:penicillin-binding protein 1A